MPPLILYMTDGCHLCEQAQQLCVQALGRPAREVDIAADPELLDRYGVRIPVLKRADNGAEIGWPFSAADVRRLSLNDPPQGTGT